MTNQEIIERVRNAKKGRCIHLTKVKPLGNGIVKESEMVIRLGVNYQNLSMNEGRVTGGLKWGHWVEGLENLVLEHKGQYYLRITSKTPEHPEDGADVVSTRYLKGSKILSKEDVIAEVGSKPLEGRAAPVYNIKFENIVSIG